MKRRNRIFQQNKEDAREKRRSGLAARAAASAAGAVLLLCLSGCAALPFNFGTSEAQEGISSLQSGSYDDAAASFQEQIDEEGHSHVTFRGTLQYKRSIMDLVGEGNGPIDAFFNAIQGQDMAHFTFLDYKSHAISDGSDSQGVAYILLQDENDEECYWGVGLSHNINLAPLRAILSAINRAAKKKGQ
jgi:hypothetical protein